MIQIDERLLEHRKFSGRIILCFENGRRTHIITQETLAPSDPHLDTKAMRNGVFLEEVQSSKSTTRDFES